MFKQLKSKLVSGKDTTISFAIQKVINTRIKSKGFELENFLIDTQKKTIEGKIIFIDNEPLSIKAYGYHITTKNDKYFLEVDNIEKSREWDNSYIDGKRYKIPSEVLKIVEFIL